MRRAYAILWLSWLISVGTEAAEPRFSECDADLTGGVTAEEAVRYFHVMFKHRAYALWDGRPLRFLADNQVEINVYPGGFDRDLNLVGARFGLLHHRHWDTEESARTLNTELKFYPLHRIWFAKDFMRLRMTGFNDFGQPTHLFFSFNRFLNRAIFQDPVDNIDQFHFATADSTLLHQEALPEGEVIPLPPQGLPYAEYDGPLAKEIFEVVGTARPYDDSELIARHIEETLNSVSMDPAIKERIRQHMQVRVYRKGLIAQSIPHIEEWEVIFKPATPIEAQFILAGLKALGLRPEHPIFTLVQYHTDDDRTADLDGP